MEWYYIIISALFFILLGIFMSAAYTIFYNNKRIIFKWNVIMGILAACAVEFNNLFVGADILLPITFLIIYPTVFIGSLSFLNEVRNFKGDEHNESSEAYEEGHIIR